MKKMFKVTSLFLAAVMLVLAVMPLTAFAAQSTDQTYTVANYTIHNTADNGGYTPGSSNKVSSFSTGHTRLGTLKVSGNVAKKSYNGYEAYAVYGGKVSFTYNQTWSDKSNGGYDWKLSSDSYTSINGVSTGTIGDGGIIIMKSTNDGATWSLAAKSVGINGDTITFTPDGKDIQTGVLYKFISVCETYYTYVSGRHKDWKFWPFTYDWVDEYSNHYENLMQQTIVYLASDSAQIGFYSGATDNYDVAADFNDVSAETLEVIKKGTTLTHNSVSLDYIRVDKLGNQSFSVTCSYNNSEYFKVADGEKFTNPGRYHFVITTKFLTQRELDIYILDPKDDYAYSQYFGSGFVSQNMRMYDKESQVPVYMIGTMLNVAPAANLPGLYGNIYRYENAKAVETDEYTIVYTFNAQTTAQTIMLNDTGIYCADLYVGDPNAGGEIIHYGFYLVISDNADYAPTVNLEMLTSADRHVMLKTATYVVSFPTAGGGSYLFMFENTLEGYEAALEFAEQIEYRFIEEYEENGVKYYYYKSPTSNVKDRYNKVDLYAEVQKNYTSNVNLVYSTNNDSYATMTIDEAVANVENTSIRNDIKVCVDIETRNKLVSSDVIVNGYKFYQAAEYESARITATSESGEIFQVPYGVSAENIFPHTGVYKITESNWCNTVEYYVTYIAEGEVTGVIDFTATKNFSDFSGKISSASTSVIEANSITLVSGIDKYDSQTIVTVTKDGERKSMLITEVNGYTIEEPGTYEIVISNRCGGTTKTTVIITEAPKTAVEFDGYAQYNREVKYGELFGELPEVARYGYDFRGWTVNGKRVTANTVCEWKYNVTLIPVFEAKTVEIILNSYNDFETFKAEFGTKISLTKMADVEGYFAFAYWELDGKRVEELEITELGTMILVAKYYEINADKKVITTATYSANELSALIVARRAEEAKRAAEEEAARAKAEAEAAAARAKAEAEAEAARVKAEAEAEVARAKAEAEAEAARAKAEAEAEADKKVAEAEAEAAKKVAEAEAEANKKTNEAETENTAEKTDANAINNGNAGSHYDDNTNHEYAKNSYINDVNDYNATYNNAGEGVNWTVILIVAIIAAAVVAIVVMVFKMYCI